MKGFVRYLVINEDISQNLYHKPLKSTKENTPQIDLSQILIEI